LIDRITILQIKSQHLSGTALVNVATQLSAPELTLARLNLSTHPELLRQLKDVNASLWDIENEIREKERAKDFGDSFVRLARSVYQQHDRRAAIKQRAKIPCSHRQFCLPPSTWDTGPAPPA